MAIKLNANYAKRLGLPGYSSHNFSVSVETELRDLGDVQGEATRLYGLLQDAVDREIQHTGFVPGHDYGMETSEGSAPAPGKVLAIDQHNDWKCSPKQQELILKLVDEHGLVKDSIDELATKRFGRGVKELDKMQASGLIDELFDMTGKKKNPAPRRNAYGKGRS